MQTMTAAPRRTALFEAQKKLGAKFTEFAGWEMPVIFTSITQEHMAVREQAGLFDISHMGQIYVEGDSALAFLQKICTNDISRCKPKHGIYSHMLNERGGVIDDIFVYWLDSKKYLVVVNAATIEKDFSWMKKQAPSGVELSNASDSVGMLALQGPKAQKIANKIFSVLPDRHGYLDAPFQSHKVSLCRTGYTGEDGFEMIAPTAALEALWKTLLDLGQSDGILPCALGARDTLRLEAGYLLYGMDMDDDHTTLESGPNWVVKMNKDFFIGKDVLEKQQKDGLKRKLTAFKLTDRGIPRHLHKIYCDGREVGVVTSGTYSPLLKVGIALGYVPPQLLGAISIDCGGKKIPAEVTSTPFYKK